MNVNPGNPRYVTPHGLAQMKNGTNNYNQAYMPSQNLIDRVDFRNTGQLLHNNVGDIVQTERVTEYTIWIDSNDRDQGVFPNPFDFAVSFGGVSKSTDSKFVNNQITAISYSGTPKPTVQRHFKNVKYIKINYVILPRTNTIEISGNTNAPQYTIADNDTNFGHHRFMILRIKEIRNSKFCSTNNNVNEDCFIMYPDRIMGSHHTMWIPTSGTHVFPNSRLFDLNRMTIVIEDDQGNELDVIDTNGNILNMNNILTNLQNTQPGSPTLAAFVRIQNTLNINLELTVGVTENEFNTNVNF